ncbi:cation:proton antiporter domain-containing protein [Streptomyces alanosinicus]|uniref:Sodium/hydrogen exchanger n=1 Tax=Streptomyces alanosinicus TaxID=68171 RepID=A0A919D3Y0_9ACTN|nr:cation:proton antiporter [Streptomyces alanosinicus]GHE05634.1 sodium/hydrogen exchanger [Streptomyces alanosinicus]
MLPTILAAAVMALVRSLAALRLQRWHLGAPAAMVLAGILVGLGVENSVVAVLNTEVAQHAAEIILAFLLFVDATEVRGGRLWGNSPRLVTRMLLVALPLSLGTAMLVGKLAFPGLSWAMMLVLACVVVPIDFAPSEQVVRDRRLPARVRSVLNVESGYNDGIVSPLFLFALLLAGGSSTVHTPLDALATAAAQASKAVLAGLVIGSLVGWLLHQAGRAGWTTEQSRRISVVLTPLIAYTAGVEIGGNGFVTSFVCGIAFRYVHRVLVARRIRGANAPRPAGGSSTVSRDFGLLEDATALMTMWFVVGIAAVVTFSTGVSRQAVLFCLAALTVIRIVPVLVSLVGSPLARRDRLLLGLLGPRGTTTIVFGLIAFNGLPDGVPADTVLLATVLCVLGSVLFHGMGSDLMIRRLLPPPVGGGEPADQGMDKAQENAK